MRPSWVVRFLLVAVLAAGCTEARRAAPAPPPSTTTSTTTTIPRYPLTGVPAGDPQAGRRAAVTVKIDNNRAARPQAGVEKADLVYEEFTEGITRFVVVFHSSDAELVGPVRSVRPADPAIVTPLGGVLGFSGGSPAAVEVAQQAPLTLVTEGDREVLYRRPGRDAPHNLYTSTEGLRARAPAEAGPPPKFADFLEEGQQFTAAETTPVSRLSLVPAPYATADYDWDGESRTWKRTTDGAPHVLEGDVQIAPRTVIVQFTAYQLFIPDMSVLYPEVLGSGEAWIFTAGVLAKGSWSKPSPEAVTAFTDTAGKPIVLPAGQTWIHLVEPGSPVTPS